MLTGPTSSVQAELDAFFADLANRAKRKRVVSAQAFAKARYKLHHDLFQPLLTQLVALIEGQRPSPRWHGRSIVAADASKLRFTKQKDGIRSVVEAVAFALFLPGIELCLAANLYPTADGERQMLFEHLAHLTEDDCYPAADFGALYHARWRIKEAFNLENKAPIFIFSPGIRHSWASTSISLHSACRNSPGRTKTRGASNRAQRVTKAP